MTDPGNGNYTFDDWYIPQKYENLKLEVINNTICTLTKEEYQLIYKFLKVIFSSPF